MPLSPPAPRSLSHTRRIECNGYRRADGLWDIEGHLTDVKTRPIQNAWRGELPPGEPIHEMWVRLTVDDALLVRDIEVSSDKTPFRICPDIAPGFAVLKGLQIGPGWNRAVKERVGGVKGCTHIVELMGPLATVAYQTIYWAAERKESQRDPNSRPHQLDTCHALASDSEVVREHFPQFYRGR
jgi:hypothetical protein